MIYTRDGRQKIKSSRPIVSLLPADEYWGGNLVKNYPSLEQADGAQPRWWDVNGSATLTEEDTAGESIDYVHDRCLKIVMPASPTASDYAYQQWTHADEPTLNDSETKISTGFFVETPDAGTVTVELYNVGGGFSLDSVTTTTTGKKVYVELTDILIGTTSTQLRIYHSAANATVYVQIPQLNIGANVIQWSERGLVYRQDFSNDVVDTATPPTSFTDLDLSSNVPPLTAKVAMAFNARPDTGACGVLCRANGSSETGDSVRIWQTQGNDGSNNNFEVLCDEGQVIEHKITVDNVDIYRFSVVGAYVWQS